VVEAVRPLIVPGVFVGGPGDAEGPARTVTGAPGLPDALTAVTLPLPVADLRECHLAVTARFADLRK
jgi:hypothetical protein